MSFGSSIDVAPPEPSQTRSWQSPGVWSEAGATRLPGYRHAPDESQSWAPHAETVAGQVVPAAQQWVPPEPFGPQRPLAHSEPALQGCPAASSTQTLLVQTPLVQSLVTLHWTQPPLEALHAGVAPVQVVCDPPAQLFDALHVAAAVNTLPLQEAPEQSPLALHWTQPFVALHLGVPALVEQSVVAAVAHDPLPVQLEAAVKTVPEQDVDPHAVELGQSAQADPSCLQLPFSPQVAEPAAAQLVAQQILLAVLVSSVTQALPVPHSALVLHWAPRAFPVQTLDTQLIETQSVLPPQCLVSAQGGQAVKGPASTPPSAGSR
jgi:hypothetical protein